MFSSTYFLQSLVYGKKRIDFRNNQGKVLAHRGGGNKLNFIIVDYKQFIWHVRGFIISIFCNAGRTGKLALVSYPNGLISHILAPAGLYPGTSIYSGYDATFSSIGSRFYLWQLPLGTKVYNIELISNSSGIIARSAGVFAIIIRKTINLIVLRLPSKELKAFKLTALANVGQVSNGSHQFINLGKAGVSRWLGRRSVVRGVAKNPVDHPHGGGEGKTSGGRPSVTPWGKITKGQPTRNLKKPSIKSILRFRNGLNNSLTYVH